MQCKVICIKHVAKTEITIFKYIDSTNHSIHRHKIQIRTYEITHIGEKTRYS